jgi:uroporphyrin-3 C-methyltransferase
MLVAIVIVAALLSIYAHWRFGQYAERIDRLRANNAELRSNLGRLEGQITSLLSRVDASSNALRNELRPLTGLPGQVNELGKGLDELRARTEAPQRAWVRSEALYLLELAERRLALEQDVATAVVAMESADARLAAMRDPGVAQVRATLKDELTALRAVAPVDLQSISARISALEDEATTLPVLGTPIARSHPVERQQAPGGPLERATQRIGQATRDLFSLRRVDPGTARLVTQEEESLRRQHLELLLLAARVAAMQRDAAAFRGSLQTAESWLDQFFDTSQPAVAEVRAEIVDLSGSTINPLLPTVGAAAEQLRRIMRGAAPPEA